MNEIVQTPTRYPVDSRVAWLLAAGIPIFYYPEKSWLQATRLRLLPIYILEIFLNKNLFVSTSYT